MRLRWLIVVQYGAWTVASFYGANPHCTFTALIVLPTNMYADTSNA
jgi:hypothetical protein